MLVRFTLTSLLDGLMVAKDVGGKRTQTVKGEATEEELTAPLEAVTDQYHVPLGR